MNSLYVPFPHSCQIFDYAIFELWVHAILKQAFLFYTIQLEMSSFWILQSSFLLIKDLYPGTYPRAIALLHSYKSSSDIFRKLSWPCFGYTSSNALSINAARRLCNTFMPSLSVIFARVFLDINKLIEKHRRKLEWMAMKNIVEWGLSSISWTWKNEF